MTAMQAVATEHAAQTAAAQNERALWALAHKLNADLASKLLSQGSSVENALVAIHGVMSHSPTPQPQQAPTRSDGMTAAEWDRQMAQARGEEFTGAGDGSIAAFGGYLGDQFSREMAHGAAVAKSILAKVELTR
jgi:hypothetical protein